jgi:hypothetical protein
MTLSTKADDDQFISSTWQLLYRNPQVVVVVACFLVCRDVFIGA